MNLTEGVVRRNVFHLAWPAVTTMSLQVLVGFVDMMMVGSLGPAALAAVGVSNQFIAFALGVIFTLTVGTTALVARYTGSGEEEKAQAVARQSLVLLSLGAIVLSLLGILFPQETFSIILALAEKPDPELLTAGSVYTQIVSSALFFRLSMMTAHRIMEGAGDTRTPLYIMSAVNAVNLLTDYLLIYGIGFFPALGVKGAAIATALSVTVGSVISFIVLFGGKSLIQLPLKGDYRPQKAVIRDILYIGSPAVLHYIIVQGSRMAVTLFVASLGTVALAANQIVTNANSISVLPARGFATAATTMVGQNLGAGKIGRAKRSGFEATRLVLLAMVLTGFCLYLFPNAIARVFTVDAGVIVLSVKTIRLLALGQPFMGASMVLAGALRGAGDTRWIMLVTLFGATVIRTGGSYLLGVELGYGLLGIWGAVIIFVAYELALHCFRFHSERWKDAFRPVDKVAREKP